MAVIRHLVPHRHGGCHFNWPLLDRRALLAIAQAPNLVGPCKSAKSSWPWERRQILLAPAKAPNATGPCKIVKFYWPLQKLDPSPLSCPVSSGLRFFPCPFLWPCVPSFFFPSLVLSLVLFGSFVLCRFRVLVVLLSFFPFVLLCLFLVRAFFCFFPRAFLILVS